MDGKDRDGEMVVRRERSVSGLYMVVWRAWVLLIMGIIGCCGGRRLN